MTGIEKLIQEEKEQGGKSGKKTAHGALSAYTIAKLIGCTPMTAYLKLEKATFTYYECRLIQQALLPSYSLDFLFLDDEEIEEIE